MLNLQLGRSTPRGTILSNWTLEKPAACHTRGLCYGKIQEYSPDGSGLLVAQAVLPNGPSDTKLEEADILLTVNNKNVTSLRLFEQFIDNAVGRTIKLRVHRHGDTFESEVQVQDLSTLTQYRLVEYAGSAFHALDNQTAFRNHMPLEGVVLCDDEGSFMLKGEGRKIIRSLNYQSTPNLDTFIEVARLIPGECYPNL